MSVNLIFSVFFMFEDRPNAAYPYNRHYSFHKYESGLAHQIKKRRRLSNANQKAA